jgi:membrane-bound lytic murein transglycosylase D
MWQFMRVTGKEYGLRIDRSIDERRDPFESTRAAAALLNQNYQTLGSWPLALTAYNYGAGGIARAVADRQSDDLVELIRDYNHPYWGFAPKNFYAEFLAAVDVAKNINQYFPGTELDAPLIVQEIELKKGVSLALLAKNTRLTHSELLGWNPALSAQTRSIPVGYRVKVPLDSRTDPIIQVAQTWVQEPPARVQEPPDVLRHRVKRGETLMQIARRYGASVAKIMQINGMRKSHPLQVGSTLLIPKV